MTSCSRNALLLITLVCSLLAGLASIVQYFVLELSLSVVSQALIVSLVIAFAVWVITSVQVVAHAKSINTRRYKSRRQKALSLPSSRTLHERPSNSDKRRGRPHLNTGRSREEITEHADLQCLMGELATLEDQLATEVSRMTRLREN